MISILDIKDLLNSQNEAKFNKKKSKKVSDILASLFGKKLGGEFKLLGGGLGRESFSKGSIKGEGFKYINKSGNIIRFGFIQTKDKRVSSEINSVDYWEKSKGADIFSDPTVSIELKSWMNIIDVVAEIHEILVGNIIESKLNENVPAGSRPPKKMIAYANFYNVDYYQESDTYAMLLKRIKEEGQWDEEEYKGYKVTKGQKETNTTKTALKTAEKKLSETKYADPDIIFNDIEKLTKVVAMGLQNSLLVVGSAGLGKTFHVEKTMKELLGDPSGPGARWRYRQGAKLSPMGLYQDLFMNRDDVTIVYDDSRLVAA